MVRKHGRDLRDCYEMELQQDRSPSGKIVLRAVVDEDGTVRTVKIASNTTGSPSMGQCMTRRAKRWRFPKPKGGGIAIMTASLAFRSRAEVRPPPAQAP